MKLSLRIISYALLIFTIVIFPPLSESLKTEDNKPLKKILSGSEVLKEETALGLSEGEEEILDESEAEEDSEKDEVNVKKVIDGDTIVLEDGRIIRLIGINTPEKYQKFGKEATLKTKELVLDKEVNLEYDKLKTDIYGRTLAYVYTEEVFVNLELLKQGFARLMTIPPNTKHLEEFRKAYKEAKDKKLGVWKDK